LDGIGIGRSDVFAMPYNRLAAPLEAENGIQPLLVPLDGLEQIWSLDIHVADHCNLRCKACGHFSCLADGEVFHDAETVEKSLERLADLVPNICNLHILGGEPLLHPELPEIVAVARRQYPLANMTMATNGILLTRMSLRLRSSLKNNQVKVIVSLYPPLFERVDELAAWLGSEGLPFRINRIDSFERRILPRPIFDKRRMFAKCGHKMCLRGSRVGYCVMALFTDYYNRRFGPGRLPEDPGVDVFAHAGGKSFLAALNRPLELCRQCVACDAGKQYFRDWAPAGKNPRPEDWFIDFPLDAALARRGD
ncbi:MAG: radical SAM protein, partial [Planctomycetota bacterium]|nr:radical SAM protein [Planctomycetota bacterium]